MPLPKPAGFPFYDVSGDGNANALDVLMVINEINRLNTQLGGEGESGSMVRTAAPAGSNHLDDVLRKEETWEDIIEDIDLRFASGRAVDDFFADLGR